MGQYYTIVNVDRQEAMCPFDYDNGLKLMEWSHQQNSLVVALMNLLADSWKGDRVCVLGDYASTEYPDEPWYKTYMKYAEELHIGEDCLYDYCNKHFTMIVPENGSMWSSRISSDRLSAPKRNGCIKDPGYRYIYNHATRQVIDIHKCPIEWVWYNKAEGKSKVINISPLILLLTMGNGLGGGDYCGHGRKEKDESMDLAGTWCSTVSSIEVSVHPLPGTSEYEEFEPNFTENNPVIPYTQKEEEIEKAEAEALLF